MLNKLESSQKSYENEKLYFEMTIFVAQTSYYFWENVLLTTFWKKFNKSQELIHGEIGPGKSGLWAKSLLSGMTTNETISL